MKNLVMAVIIFAAISVTLADDLGYSPDGGLVSFGDFDYVYDSASRLTEVWSNGVQVIENRYDALGRRVIKWTPDATRTFVYDGWLLVVERIERSGGQLDQIDYWWGKDVSGTLDGAGGIGGLLYLRKNGSEVFVPLYDGHGNVVQYVDKQGGIVAEYAYDAFGNTIRKSGVKAGELKMRFSTKYHDDESGLYYFGRRFYSPRLARWLSRDPIEEDGGLNLYAYCGNNAVSNYDELGLNVTLTTGNRGASWWQIGNRFLHQEICVDTWVWNRRSCCWNRTGRSCFSFAATGIGIGMPGGKWLGVDSIKGPGILRGKVYQTEDQGLKDAETLETTPCQDKAFMEYLISLIGQKDTYSVGRHSCRTFSQAMMEEAKRRSGGNNGGCKHGRKCK